MAAARRQRDKRERQPDGRREQGDRTDRPGLSPRQVFAAVALLSVAHFTLAVTSIRHKSATYDELAHVTRGYSYALTGDFRLGPPHPPLAHWWAALPGLGGKVRFPPLDQNAWYTSDMWEIGRQFFYYANRGNDAISDALLFRGRMMVALLSTGVGLLVFFWSRRLFGPAGGLISLTLCTFSPTMLAHGSLVTTDCAVTLFFLASLAAIAAVLRKVSPVTLALGAAALVGLFLSKMSAVLIIPIGVVLLGLRLLDPEALPVTLGRWRTAMRTRLGRLGCWLAVMAVWVAVVWTAIWAAYGFRYEAMRQAEPGRDRFYSSNAVPAGKDIWDHQLRSLDHLRPTIDWLRRHRVFPEAYIYSMVFSAQTARGRLAYMNGTVSIHGHPWFFPYAFLVKTPLPLFGLLAAAAAVPLARRLTRQGRPPEATSAVHLPATDPPARGDRPAKATSGAASADAAAPWWRGAYAVLCRTAPLWVFLIVYWAASLRTHLNIGHRHILPTYPVLFIFSGATAWYLERAQRLTQAIPLVLIGLFVLAGFSVYPHYLAYFNWIAGGPDGGYRHLVDSSLDWGQDLPGLSDYLQRRKQRGNIGDVYVACFGSGGPPSLRHFGITDRTLPLLLAPDAGGQYEYTPGLYAISATRLQQVYDDADGRTPLHTWTDALERQYRGALPLLDRLAATPDNKEARKDFAAGDFRKIFDRFQRLRFARLCAFLRARQPDDIVNHTILIFELDEAELAAALSGSAPPG